MQEDVDPKKLRITRHEAGHAVMALICHQRLQKISLREMDSPHGTGKWRGSSHLESSEQKTTFTEEDGINKIRISLGGCASEIIFYDGAAKGWGDDFEAAAKWVERMLQIEKFRVWAIALPVPEPSNVLDATKSPVVRACIEYGMNECVQTLTRFKPVIHLIAEELYKREELTGDEIFSHFSSFMRSIQGSD